MSGDDVENTLREQLHGAIDPMVPGTGATDRVMDMVSASAARGGRRFAGLPIGQGLGALLMASAVVALVGGALGLSLALRSQPSNGPPGAGAPTPAPIPTATSTPPTFSPSPVIAVTACEGSSLSASFIDFDGAAGAEGGDIRLRNIGLSPCTMEGYTNLQGVSSGHATQLGVAHTQAVLINNSNHTLPKVTPITLQPGASAYVAIEWTDVQSTSTACPVYRTLLITPPGAADAVRLTVTPPITQPFMICGMHGAAMWVDEAPVSVTRYFYQPS